VTQVQPQHEVITENKNVVIVQAQNRASVASEIATPEIVTSQVLIAEEPVNINVKAILKTETVPEKAIGKIAPSEEVKVAVDKTIAVVEVQTITEKMPKLVEVPVAERVNSRVQKIEDKTVKAEKPKLVPVKEEVIKTTSKKENDLADRKKTPYLKVTTATLTYQERANIYLKKADRALSKGDTLLASQEKSKALDLKPELHDVRTSLALYYYGIGEQDRATTILKKGVLQFPEHADFSLMLSRIALKTGDQQKAYLYLNQHPPIVKGNLDYHVSYAILAQKFKKYAQAEAVYAGLLTHRPNNGRWIMSLAIAQDKQDKQGLAIANYQKALLQIDLSNNAKQYVNQRLTYLKSQ
jgi:Flp pilus assembly protein TadD